MPNKDSEKSKENIAKKLIKIAESKNILFCDYQEVEYAVIHVDGHKEIYSIESPKYRKWLRKEFFLIEQEGVSETVMKTALETIKAKADFGGIRQDVFLRVAQIDEVVYIDLCNENWEVIRIDNSGWKVIKESPVYFTRNGNMKPLPIPKPYGNIDMLIKHLNIDIVDLPLIVGWLIMSLQKGSGAYPILILNGTAGTGKTTASRMLRSLIDPNKCDLLSKPKTEDLRVIGANHHVFAFDNLSGISNNMSDSICKISTGDNQSVRKLYTTNDEFTISLKKPCLLNGIDDIAKRDDLVSRSIKVNLMTPKIRKDENQIWNDFDKDKPYIFGVILDGLSKGLASYKSIKIEDITRMADFCKISSAACLAFNWLPETFMKAYRKSIKNLYLDALESSMFGSAIMNMFEKENKFHGRPSDLLYHLEFENYAPGKYSQGWVKTAKGVVSQLDRLKDSLSAADITYRKYKNRDNKTFIEIEKASGRNLSEKISYSNYA